MIDSSSSLFEDIDLSFEESGDLSWETFSQSLFKDDDDDDDISDMSSSNHSDCLQTGGDFSTSSSSHSSSASSHHLYNNVSDYDEADEFGEDDDEEETLPSNNYENKISSISSAKQVPNLGSLAMCMEKSSVTRALIENFCKSTLKRPSTSELSLPTMSPFKQTTCMKEYATYQRDAPSTISTTPSIKKSNTVKKARKTIKKRKKTNKKDPAFRLTGLKISEEKIKILDAKLRLLDHQPIKSWTIATVSPASSTTSIADFLRQNKR
jgi:hypothetical protein